MEAKCSIFYEKAANSMGFKLVQPVFEALAARLMTRVKDALLYSANDPFRTKLSSFQFTSSKKTCILM